MVLLSRNSDVGEALPQTVPSAGFTPPCDYSNFADSFDLSLLPGGETLPVSPSTTLYSPPPMSVGNKPKISATFYPNSPSDIESDVDFGPDFQKLLGSENSDKGTKNLMVPAYLEVPQNYPNSPNSLPPPYSPNAFSSPSDHQSFYPSSPEGSFYPHSPNSHYSHSPSDFQGLIKSEYYANSPLPTYPTYIKEESYRSPCSSILSPNSPAASQSSIPSPPHYNSEVIDLLGSAIIKQETTVDFGSLLQSFPTLLDCYKDPVPEKSKTDHQLLREVLSDTSFQKKYNIKPFDIDFGSDIKMEEPEESEMINPSEEHFPRDKIDPVLSMAIEQMRKDVNTTCAALKISSDASQWTSANVLSWLQWTSNQYNLPPPVSDQWDVDGSRLVSFNEEEFTRRAPQSGSILHAQLEIWKAAYLEEDLGTQWLPETTSSNASSGDISDDDEEESSEIDSKPSTSRGATGSGSSHIHLWQFLKELLSSPQTHGSCIRWIDRTKGIFKIEDSVRVARLWGKRKNRPAMNYDKLSRSIRQYYKKGIMKKTERSQRLVYQFCHPYNL